MKQKILVGILASSLVLSTATVSFATEMDNKAQVSISVQTLSSGTCGDNLTWHLDGGVLTISGSGDMYDYDDKSNDTPWKSSINEITEVVISDGVTSIGDYTFRLAENLSSISLPDSLRTIGQRAFIMTNLSSVVIPDSVTKIGELAFSNCYALAEISIPNGLEDIGFSAFKGTKWLDSLATEEFVVVGDGLLIGYNGDTADVVIPDNVTYIAGGAFSYSNITGTLTIPDSVTIIGADAFYNSYLKSIVIPDSVVVIGEEAFAQASLESVVIGNGVTLIDTGAFARCNDLTSVQMGNSIEIINSNAFDSSPLTELILPTSLTYIGERAFNNGAYTTLAIPDSVTHIDEYAFYGCTNLESIYIPPTVTDLGTRIFFRWTELSTSLAIDGITIYGEAGSEIEHYCANQPSVTFGSKTFDNTHAFEAVTSAPDWAVYLDGNNTAEPSTTPEPSTPTTPVYSSWAEPQVTFAEENNLLVDSLGNDYTKSITRAQIADLLVNMMEQYSETTLESASTDTFTDTSSEAVLKAYEAGIISGKGEGIFDPEATATRQEIAIMIVNAIKVLEENTGESFVDHGLTSLDGFSDFEETSDWAKNFVAILANNNIMTGSDGNLTPLSETSIQECLVLNNNLFKLGE